jgi:hypothetical protein
MAVKSHAEHGDECEHDENLRSVLMVSFCSVGPFFGSTRAASILPFSNRRHERKRFLSC